MDLKNCPTGIQTLGGYTTLTYQVYAQNDGATVDELLDVEYTLRQKKYIVHGDPNNRVLWLFEANGQGDFQSGEPDMTPFEQHLSSTSQGQFKASELAQCGSTKTPSNPLKKSLDLQNIEPRSIYSAFIAAMTSALLYRLTTSSRIIPFGPKSVLVHNGLDSHVACLSLHLYLANTGILVITAYPGPIPSLLTVSSNDVGLLGSRVLMLAPGGIPALVASENGNSSSDFDSECTVYWTTLVTKRLLRLGLQLPDNQSSSSWIKVRIPQSIDTNTPSFFWPTALVFLANSETSHDRPSAKLPRSDESRPNLDATRTWFREAQDGGFTDSLNFAQDWFLAKPDRDKILEKRAEQKAAQKRAAAAAAASGTTTSSTAITSTASPIQARSGNFGDLHPVGGVYPTPPDGIANMPPGIPPPDILKPALPLDASTSQIDPNAGNGQPSQVQRTGDGDTSMNLDDDLFGDLDDDDFGGNDITDADFSFFDEPDDTGVDASAEPHPTEGADDGNEDAMKPTETAQDAQLDTSMTDDKDTGADNDLTSNEIEPNAVGDDTSTKTQDVSMLSEQSDAMMETETKATEEPLDPTIVRRRLFPGTSSESRAQESVSGKSVFEPLSFNTNMNQTDAKYALHGMFNFTQSFSKKRSFANTQVMSISLPPSSRRKIKVMAVNGREKKEIRETNWTDDESSSESDASKDADSFLEDPAGQTLISPVREHVIRQSDLNSPVSRTNFTPTTVLDTPGLWDGRDISEEYMTELLLSLLDPYSEDITSGITKKDIRSAGSASNTNVFDLNLMKSAMSSISTDITPSDKHFINIVQIVAEQLIFGTLESFDKTGQPWALRLFNSQKRQYHTTLSMRSLNFAIKDSLQAVSDCDLMRYASIADVVPEPQSNPKGQPRPPQPRPGGARSDSTGSVTNTAFMLNCPYVRVRRNDSLWDLLPPSIPFWETLGLAPTSGPKSLTAFCIYPSNEQLGTQVESLMDNLTSAYETCKLGTHSRTQSIEDYPGGLVPLHIPDDFTLKDVAESLKETAIQLGKALARFVSKPKSGDGQKKGDLGNNDSLIVYIVDPFEGAMAFPHICSAFWAMCESYSLSVTPTFRKQKPDIVLQILPIRSIASPETLVILSTGTTQNLVREVYNRCPPAIPNDEQSPLKIFSAGSIQLAESLPRSIFFKLTANPPSNLLHENSHLHVGYSRGLSGNWITTSWTDNSGRYQATATYCLMGSRSFFEVAKEIWQTSQDIMQSRRVTWRLCIAKAGVFEREELEAWTLLAGVLSPFPVITLLMSIDLSPPLALLPKMAPPTSPLPTFINKNLNTTPASTPNQFGASPDTHAMTPVATPETAAAEATNDPDAQLVDVSDDTWGLILSHRLNVFSSPAEYRPSLTSGFLIKLPTLLPTQTPYDGAELDACIVPRLVGVHLVWIGSSARGNAQSTESGSVPANSAANITKASADNILKEYLSVYRNLALLAKVRGLKGTKGGLVPWHVAVADRGVKGLDAVFGSNKW